MRQHVASEGSCAFSGMRPDPTNNFTPVVTKKRWRQSFEGDGLDMPSGQQGSIIRTCMESYIRSRFSQPEIRFRSETSSSGSSREEIEWGS